MILDDEVKAYLNNDRATERATRASHARDNGVKKPHKVDPTTSQIDYSRHELEFMNAMQEYKQRTGRMFPTHRETLGVLRSLGYQKIGTVG